MPNSNYAYVGAPEGFPGKVFEGGYCYEHHFVWWNENGRLPGAGEVIHHKNGDKKDNRFDNLAKMSLEEHRREHAKGELYFVIECPNCGDNFDKPRRQTCFVKQEKKADFCSLSCAGKMQKTNPVSTEDMADYLVKSYRK